jgi:uncharacterized protein (DUF3084 family)
MTEMDEVQKAIQVLVETKSFSLEGVSAVNRLRDEHGTLSNKVKTLDYRISELTATNQKLTSDNQKLTEEAAKMAAREQAVTLREKEMTRIECELKCAEKMVAHTSGLFNTVFSNAQLKTHILRDVVTPVPPNPGNPQSGIYPSPGFVQKDTLKETKTQELG